MTNAQQKEMDTAEKNSEETMAFETDVFRLLDIVTNALYSNTDVFLRELISNAADACDRLRYEALQTPELTKSCAPFNIRLTPENNNTTLTITDNGIGMSREELIENLGTIARSGTAAILENLKNSQKDQDVNLIGQFGVGFYASFMVAKKVDVISRKAGQSQAWCWQSDGQTGFTIREATDDEAKHLSDNHGTAIILHMKSEGMDYLLEDKIKQIVLEYSDHVEVPIYLNDKMKSEEENASAEPINAASALWTRPKNEITDEQYKEFYHHIGNVFDAPILTSHWTAEGMIEYTALLYIPSLRPWDLYDPERKNALRLYVKRVFISDHLDSLIYPWMRFVRGIVDSQDLPLNISREMLQTNPVIQKIRNGVTKKILSEIDKLSRNDEEAFTTLWHQFGAVIKEGLYDAIEHREDIFKICRFFTTHDSAKPTTLKDYIERMSDDQDTIYYIGGENAESLRSSPQIEGFKARGIEVLLMTDTVDEFWLQQIKDYDGKKFQSITKGNIDLDKFDSKDTADGKNESKKETGNDVNIEAFTTFLQTQLSDHIAFARSSRRLVDSPVCLVADDGGVDMHMEQVLKIQQKYEPNSKPILEINPKHNLIKKLANMAENDKDNELLKDSAQMLMDQALIIQGQPLPDRSGFAKRMANFMEKGLL